MSRLCQTQVIASMGGRRNVDVKIRNRAMKTLGLHKVITATAIAFMPASAWSSTLVLSDILTVDALGYECVAGEYFEETEDQAAIAFTISEKIRLPRTCLPSPCDRALTQRELSNLTGTEVTLARFNDEWDEYYARYADHCRREVVLPGEDVSDEEFWEPILETPSEPFTTAGLPKPTVPVPTPPGVIPPPKPPLQISPEGPETPTDPPGPTDPEVSPVPLPNSLLMMLGGLVFLLRRKRS